MRNEVGQVRPWVIVAFFVIAWLASAVAWAQASNAPSVAYSQGRGVVTGGAITQRNPSDFQRLLQGRPGGGLDVLDTVRIPAGANLSGSNEYADALRARAGADFDMLLRRPISQSAAMRAGVAALKTLPYVAVGSALWAAFDDWRVRPDGQGGFLYDNGVPPITQPETVPGFQVAGQDQTFSSSPGAACAALQPLGVWPGHPSTINPAPWQYNPSWGTHGACEAFGGSCNGCNDYTLAARLAIQQTTRTNVPTQRCPASIDFENPQYSIPEGAMLHHGRCRTARYYHVPFPESAILDNVNIPAVVAAEGAIDAGIDLAPFVDAPETRLSGPASVPGPGVTTYTPPATAQNPNPAPQATSATTINITYNNNSFQTTVTNNTWQGNGALVGTPGQPATEVNVETCGLPGKPPCKIDETGTPTAANPDEAEARTAWQRLKDIATNPASLVPALPALAWNFQLPTGCSLIMVPAFSPFLEAIDVCQFQPVFHDVMSIVWLIGGLFGAISIFWRDLFGTH